MKVQDFAGVENVERIRHLLVLKTVAMTNKTTSDFDATLRTFIRIIPDPDFQTNLR